jgi:DNA-binding NarL/FixJ family response regulator
VDTVTVIRVLLADDNEFVRQSLTDLLSASADLEVVAACADGSEVVEAAERTQPDVVLLDVAMPIVNGLEAARRLRAIRPDARIMMLTAMLSATSIDEARSIGAAGFLSKTDDPDKLLQALRIVASGGTAWYGDDGAAPPLPPLPTGMSG